MLIYNVKRKERKQQKIGKNNKRKRDGNREALGTRLLCFGRAVESGETFQTFREEKVTKLLPKNIANY